MVVKVAGSESRDLDQQDTPAAQSAPRAELQRIERIPDPDPPLENGPGTAFVFSGEANRPRAPGALCF